MLHIPTKKLRACTGVLMIAFVACVHAEWKPVPGNIMTKWAEKVSPSAPLPEYPRPQFVRESWTNLNGLWKYAITEKDAAQPAQFQGEILVPFCVESALSGVKKPLTKQQRLWYRRTFASPDLSGDKHLLLHFGAVDWEASVRLNGKEIGRHRGGYDAFTFDITDAVQSQDNELIVSVTDPTEDGLQAVGKQRISSIKNPGGMYYTPCSGIWQTVWLEPVPGNHMDGLKIEPDVDAGVVRVTVQGGNGSAAISALKGGKTIAEAKGKPGEAVALKIPDAKLWSPDTPFLYDLKVTLGDDSAASYFGMRKISIGKDERGVTRPLLNNRFVFQSGPLDQGYWPDGIYTAPTDDALKFDIEITKKLGFNMTRKHAKVEPARWYYWCDKLGLLVWQDMPSGHAGRGGAPKEPALRQTAVSKEAARQFEGEFREMIGELYNYPSIVVWTVFNEGWGQYDTVRITEWVKALNPSRLVNSASGWTDFKVGDLVDMHIYPGPDSPTPGENRAAVLGEFGGLGMRVPSHLWDEKVYFSYRNMPDMETLTKEYLRLWGKVGELMKNRGLSAGVFTQITDVECELNGLLTYDRKVTKVDVCKASAAGFARGEFPPLPTYRNVIPTSRENPVAWRYVTDKPGDNWFQPEFDDSLWNVGKGGFGTIQNNIAKPRTPWKTSDIWLRRECEIPHVNLNRPVFSLYHDDNAEIYLNGVLALNVSEYNKDYEEFPVSTEAAATLKPGKNVIAVHCLQKKGGQYIDVGIQDEVEPSEE